MTNFETNPEKIKEAFEKGIITESDYLNWTGAQGYKNALQKAQEAGELTKSVFQSETSKIDGLYFERDFGANTFRFVLKGEIFKPLDLIKANEANNLLTDWIPNRTKSPINSGTKKMMEAADNLANFCNEESNKINARKIGQ